MLKFFKTLLLSCTLLLCTSFAFGQRDGIPSFMVSDVHEYDTVNLVTLSPTINLTFVKGSYTSSQTCTVFQPPHNNNTGTYCGGLFGGGLLLAQFLYSPHALYGMNVTPTVTNIGGGCTEYTATSLVGWDGLSSYSLPTTSLFFPSTCGTNSATVTTNDGTGITVTLTAGSGSLSMSNLHDVSGTSGPNSPITDAFGNDILTLGGTGPYTFTNKLGSVLTVPSTFAPSYFKYTDPNGTQQTISQVNGTQTTYEPLGNCGTLNVGSPVTPVKSISLPDGTSYQFTWDPNNGGIDGLIQTLVTRTGSVTYTYGTVTCNPWSFATLSRQTGDGKTTYSTSTANGITTTTVLDPGKNKVVYTFFNPNQNGYGTFTKTISRYQNTGSVNSPVYALISSTGYCYNNASCSAAPSYPITQRDTYEYAGASSIQMSHRVETFDSYGNTLTDANTDSVTSQTITKTLVYGTYVVGTGCQAITNTNINDHVCTSTTTNGSATIAQSGYTYNANGAITASYQWTGAPSVNLTTNYTPNANGTLASIQAPNGQVTTNTYGDCNGFLLTDSTTTVNGIAIDNKKTWNCDGPVVVDTTDPNGNEDDTTYDSMFRVVTNTDRAENTTNYAYQVGAPTYSKTTDPLGVVKYVYLDGEGRPIISQTKQSTTSSNYDTLSKHYQWNGTNWQIKTAVPCVQTLDNFCSTTAMTVLSNPIAGPISSTDANGGTTTYALAFSSGGQDVSVTTGPAPSGENTKKIENEHDGFGRIKSVCAVETSGGSSCGNAFGGSGILTSTTYSSATGSSTVTTTRGSQTHTVVSDALGRVTSYTTPEAGTVTNHYDSSSYCSTTYNGKLVDTQDAAGHYVCNYYDSSGRLADAWTAYSITGDYCKHFRYDSTANAYLGTAPSGVTVNNGVGRVVEAVTDTYQTVNGTYGYCPVPPYNSPAPSQSTIITDEWFSYDKAGRITDMWESTPHSSGYYHTTVAYDADGTVASVTLAGQCSPTFSYGVDGEDRHNSMSVCGTTTVVSATAGNGFTYNAAGLPTNVPIGTSGDQDTFSYDNVGNMLGYTFTVNGVSDAGTLTWNPIGSLRKLVITDGFNSGGSQTCTFGTTSVMGYDDVGRLLDDNCGSSLWHQSYGYDQYNNLTKTGNPGITWNPGYSSTNNRMTGSTYDNGSSPGPGNLTYDGVNSYSWNVYGQMVGTVSGNNTVSCGSSGSSCSTFDAFGKIVESSIGNQYQEMLYSPIGLLGYAQGGSVYDWYVPAPGGGDFFMVGGVMYFLHPDWLKSKRLGTSLVNRSSLFDVAYAPYGDPYDSFTSSWYYTDFTGITNEWASGIYTTPTRQLTVNSSRWPSCDPAHASWNCYSYATDPNRQIDLSGLGDCSGDNCPPTENNAGSDESGPSVAPTNCGGPLCTQQTAQAAEAEYILDTTAEVAAVGSAVMLGGAAAEVAVSMYWQPVPWGDLGNSIPWHYEVSDGTYLNIHGDPNITFNHDVLDIYNEAVHPPLQPTTGTTSVLEDYMNITDRVMANNGYWISPQYSLADAPGFFAGSGADILSIGSMAVTAGTLVIATPTPMGIADFTTKTSATAVPQMDPVPEGPDHPSSIYGNAPSYVPYSVAPAIGTYSCINGVCHNN